MRTELLSLGVGGVIAVNRVLAIANPRSAPIKQVIRRAREEGLLIDLRYGRSSQAVVFFDSGHIALVALGLEDIVSWLESWREGRSQSI
ncbi:MAG: extracellular matrix/biofilm biosynthesis regulator RemA family protein [Anaerolineae bacterium]